MMVPKIVHQTARSPLFSPLIGKCVASFRKVSPEWDYRFYSDDDWSTSITAVSVFPWNLLLRYPTGIQRSDIFRCAALYEHGGCYADVDMMGVRSVDGLIAAASELGLVNDDTERILTVDHPIHSRPFFAREKIHMKNFMLAKPGARSLENF